MTLLEATQVEADVMKEDEVQQQWEKREVDLPGLIPPDRQDRASAVLGQMSYWLLASRAYRYHHTRTCLVDILVGEFSERVKEPDKPAAALSAQILLWDAWSQTFMHLEEAAALLHATVEFGKQWDVDGQVGSDLIYDRYMSFGDATAKSGASPQSVLEKVASSFADARRTLWLPAKKEWQQLFPEAAEGEYGPIIYTAKSLQRWASELVGQLRSESGAHWYESYLRFKHGMPMIALDLFHTTAAVPYPLGQVPDEETVLGDALHQVKQMHMPVAHFVASETEDARLQRFDCTTEAAEQALGSSRALAEVIAHVCASVVCRAESEGAREFCTIKEADSG